jgi:hypothetical protein
MRPPLLPEDLGINLEEDSEDVTEGELAAAIETDSLQDFADKARVFAGSRPQGDEIGYALRRKGGILYCRLSCTGATQLFRLEWLRRMTP